jgi:hypothetical protein
MFDLLYIFLYEIKYILPLFSPYPLLPFCRNTHFTILINIFISDFLLNSDIKDELIQDYENLLVPYILEMKNTIDNVTAVTEAIMDFYFNGDILANFEANITQVS